MTAIAKELRAALKAVDDADTPDDLRSPAFLAAFWGSRSGRGTVGPSASPAQPKGTAPLTGTAEPRLLGADVPDRVQKIAAALGLQPGEVEMVYDLSADEPALLVAARFLPDAFITAAEEVTYLIVGARQALGEDWTVVDAVKEAMSERGYVDKNRNLSKLWPEIDGKGLSAKGPSNSRRLKMNGGGFKRAGEIAKRLAAAASA
jgi:hypothetical protein